MANKKWYLHPAIATGIVINAFILLLAVAWSGNPAGLDRLLVEDGIVEWMQFLCFSAIAGLLGFAFFERLKRSDRGVLELLALAGLSLLCALAALEEISWFQRVLNIQSSEFFLQNNRQGETNIHNLAMGDGSLHKNVLLKLIFITGITHNLILPLVARFKPGVQDWVEKLGLYLPPLSASVPYLVLVALSHILIDHPRKGELGELFGAVHYMATVFGAYYAGVAYRRATLFENPADIARLSKLFALWMLFLLLNGWMLSAGAGAVVK
ncbi:hypothetical protein [Massilia sp. BSC265]|uniref:hypothetical protein n=1 Tax=Massilia sp. BSC265 TaxID=1549812 RepID=UPI0004E92902|nr:hypothetical protein [Massilia sp. BSC265]KFI07510.1 hypothetical protein JN27_07850 [Massilia sp. BSC265]